jgi:hypothetical protein
MRPNGPESIRAIQSALAEVITPELTSPFAQDAAQTLQMLLESLAAEWDTAAEGLRLDNETLAGLLAESQSSMESESRGNERFAALVNEIKERLSEDVSDSIAITVLSSRNAALRGTLEQVLMALEDVVSEEATATIASVRSKIYRHLRNVATRGWSFWDVSSFRGRMTAVRATTSGDDAPQTPAVE